MRIDDVVLLKVGTWNGEPFTLTDLKGIQKAYEEFALVLSIPLKFGHNDEQPMTDGEPRIGTVESVRVQDGKLIANFINLPEIVHAAISQNLYTQVSVELDADVVYKGKRYDWVLTGLALLGADLPAVNGMADLAQYITGNPDKKPETGEYKASRNLKFSLPKEDMYMPLTAEEEAKLRAAAQKAAELEVQLATLNAEKTQLSADKEALEKATKEAAFQASKKEVAEDLEKLTKVQVISPAQRDAFETSIKDDVSLSAVKTTVETLKMGVDPKKFDNPQGTATDTDTGAGLDEGGQDADQVLLSRARKLRSVNPKLSLSAARTQVLREDPKLAREYVDLTPVYGKN